MDDEKPYVLLLKESYLAGIENSVGSRLFRNLFFTNKDTQTDVLRDGDLACAYYVSSILRQFNLIGGFHTVVDRTVEDMLENGWHVVTDLKPGAVLVWEAKTFESGESHKHIGFYLGDRMAVSNSDKERSPQRHPYDSHAGRAIECILWHRSLD